FEPRCERRPFPGVIKIEHPHPGDGAVILRPSPLFGVACLAFAGPATAADLAPPRVKPLSEQTLGLKPYEYSSSDPSRNMTRVGGGGRRGYAISPDGRLLAAEDAGGWRLELWDTATGKSHGVFGRIWGPVSLDFAPGGKVL